MQPCLQVVVKFSMCCRQTHRDGCHNTVTPIVGGGLKNSDQEMNMGEKLTLAVDRNSLILLGKLPLR
jgi:hypothetical protein